MPPSRPPVRGDIARALRLARGHILRDVHTATGIHVSTLSQIEHGRRVGKPHLQVLAEHLGVPADVLAGHRPALGHLRRAVDITAPALAVSVGVDVEHLARLEAGEDVPDARLTRKLAAQLGVKPSTLAWAAPVEVAA